LGIGFRDAEALRLGQYSGQAEKRGHLLLDFSLVQRDEASGRWVRVGARNLGLDNRELNLALEEQGQWLLSLDHSRITRLEPLRLRSTIGGLGSTVQVLGALPAAVESGLGTQRDRFGLGFERTLAKGLTLQVRYQYERKEGDRLFGRGSGQLLTEPIDNRHQQLELSLGWVGERLQLQGGYVGSAFSNLHDKLQAFANPAATTPAAEIALAPDNEAHQWYLGGGYTFMPGTRGSFKLARTVGRQNDPWGGLYSAAARLDPTVNSLDARLETTNAYLGLSSRLGPQLVLLANARHDERRDLTPRHAFLTATAARDGLNTPFSRRATNLHLEAQWWTPLGVRLGLAVDDDQVNRSTLAIRQASWREGNHEQAWRLEARTQLSETLGGTLSFQRADRSGSPYLAANNAGAPDFIDPLHFADRQREKLRFLLDWAPLEPLSLQLALEDALDRFDGRPLGPDRGRMQLAALDATWTISEAWQLTGWLSRDENDSRQFTRRITTAATGAGLDWVARLRTEGDAMGLGLRARPMSKVEMGLDYSRSRDANRYHQAYTDPAATTAPLPADMPTVVSRRESLRLFASYALRKDWQLRLEAGSERWRSNDWTFDGWAYADGSTANVRPRERSNFMGLSLQWRL
jgi:MtrB/PioB family decaheme-associated outer membrane protein